MSGELEALGWPLERLGEAVAHLGRRAGLGPLDVELPASSAPGGDPGHRVEAAAELLGLEAEEVIARYARVDALLRRSGPALWLLPGEGRPRLLLLLGAAGRSVRLLGPELAVCALPLAQVRAALRQGLEVAREGEVARVLEGAAVPRRERERVRGALMRELLGDEALGRCWVLRQPPGAPFWRQALHAGLHRGLALLIGTHALQYALWLLSWWVMGQSALRGHFAPSWMAAWALLLLSMLPLRMLSTRAASALAVDTGALLKARLLAGALRLEAEEVRPQGAGHLLGRVLESEAVESLATTGGALGVVALVELLFAAGVLWSGAGGAVHGLLMLVTLALTGLATWRFYRDRDVWTAQRSGMANGLVERMLGHRTRLAQQHPERWHDGEEHELRRYLGLSQAMDRSAVVIQAVIPRAWLILCFLALAPGFIGGASPTGIAVGIGGSLLVYQALRKLTSGLTQLTGAAVAWRQTRQLFDAAARIERPASLDVLESGHGSPPAPGSPLLVGQGLVFRHPQRAVPILDGCSLEIGSGDRLLLEGSSGSGKTTLGALLAGLRRPQSGLLLLQGLDRRTLGPRWRALVSAAPQFHENHVLTGTFAFNLLMGRQWPPSPEALEEAEEVCRELGLGPLLARMPDGMHQVVGETGWPLSHGEKSRLFIARTLLQRAELLVLDESFAALDVESLRTALGAVIRRARTLLVIAHP